MSDCNRKKIRNLKAMRPDSAAKPGCLQDFHSVTEPCNMIQHLQSNGFPVLLGLGTDDGAGTNRRAVCCGNGDWCYIAL